jgi:hypothetical protein
LKYAYENGCTWIAEETCEKAAINGHLDCLKYAHENGCPLNIDFTINTSLKGCLDCLKYIVINFKYNDPRIFKIINFINGDILFKHI